MSNNEGDDILRRMTQEDDDGDIRIIGNLGNIMRNMHDDDDDDDENIRVVAAIDFGTTFSGFAYAYKSKPSKIFVYKDWQYYIGCLNYKTPTVLRYDESNNVIAWGYSALADPPESESQEKQNKKKKKKQKKKQPVNAKIVERFKLHLCKMKDKDKIYLPKDTDFKTAIKDYLKEMCEVMKETFKNPIQEIDFYKQVLIIMTVPAEFDNQSISVMRQCAFDAKLINSKNSPNLKFTTEPEAAAINCMDILKELDVSVDKSFTVVDCGGGTVDLTTRKLLEGNKLGEKIKRKGGFCGGSFVDDQFVEFLSRKVGPSAIKLLKEKNYGQLQYMVQEFCRRIKFPFTGQKKDFKPFNLDLEELCPAIKQHVKGSERDEMEEEEWIIELKFEDVKDMFDPVINQILDLISEHLDETNEEISAMLLVGGFSESKYLREKVREKFNDKLKKKISFPDRPITAIVDGAVQYGLKRDIIATRVLKWTYGTDVTREWKQGDPEDRKFPGGDGFMGRGDGIVEFSRLAKCGEEIPVNAAIPRIFSPGCILQRFMGLDIYITDKEDADFCDSPGVKQLGNWVIDIPITLTPRPILFFLIFGEIELNAIAINLETGRKHETTFKVDENF
ncbi:hypothetical protein RclHR1_03900010 [Rhizophagus clarus]|uniref:Actin-like ATPase domain-containing protein n=1 Tax=Rhizophagus clarus TaxID=94130 RepID=A0A2Z6RHL2_9GLOM|nr:hypothetical protein RclHR1_03900010 [Rhizophagus clarus]GES97335.1 hypothetical protein GLOIN_2v1678329 [Rhizophagus clarus]